MVLYLEYASQFFSNLGNYKSFGDKKFIPQLSEDKFRAVVEAAGNANLTSLYTSVEKQVYSTDLGLLGWPEKAQLSNYYPDSVASSPSPKSRL